MNILKDPLIYKKIHFSLFLLFFIFLFQAGFAYAEHINAFGSMGVTPPSAEIKTQLHKSDDTLTPNLLLYEGVKKNNIIIVEKSTQRLYIFDDDQNILKTFKITTGKNGGNKLAPGDKRTPEGIYFATDVLKAAELSPEYGIMAIPMNYPNPIDIAKKRRGYGIWIHATNHEDRLLKPNDTKGCVVTVNGDILEIARYINLETTPIIILNQLNYTTPEKLKEEGDEIKTIIDNWKEAWEKKDIEPYLSYYDKGFSSQGMNIDQWKAYKENLFNHYSTVKIKLSDLKLIKNNEYITAVFKQNFNSNSLQDTGIKRLYLTKSQGTTKGDAKRAWKISAEEWVELPQKSPTKIVEEYIAKNHIKVPEKIFAKKPVPKPISKDKIGIEDFYFSTNQPYEMKFKLINESENDEKLTGRITVVAIGKSNDGQSVYGSYPQMELKDDGTPIDFQNGEWYSIKRFKIVTGQLKSQGDSQSVLDQENISISAIKIFVYSNSGELILLKEFPNKAAKE